MQNDTQSESTSAPSRSAATPQVLEGQRQVLEETSPGLVPRTQNTNKMGWYMIYNHKTAQFYLGGTKEMSRRVSDYSRELRDYFARRVRDSTGRPRLFQSFINDIEQNECTIDDFVFIPLVLFDM